MNKTFKMIIMKRQLHCLAVTCLLLNFNLKLGQVWANASSALHNNSKNLDLFKYEKQPNEYSHETTTILPYYMKQMELSSSNINNKTNNNSDNYYYKPDDAQQQPQTDLYTIELTSSSHQHARQAKHDDIVYNYKCPKQHFIHPCECLELDKRADMFEGSGEMSDDINANGTPTFEMIEEEPVHPDLIETVVLCKNIRNVQVLSEAIRGFQGHRVNFFVLDGCKLPPFPNNLFKGIHVVWMEILNSTMQFHDNFLNMRHCP